MLHKYSCVFWLPYLYVLVYLVVDCVWNVMAHAQKPDFVFRRNRRVHFNRRGRQLSRLLAAEVCASVLVMLDKPRSEVVWEYWLPTPYASFPFTSPSVRHRVSSHFNWTLHRCDLETSWMRRPSQWGLLRQKTNKTTLLHEAVNYSRYIAAVIYERMTMKHPGNETDRGKR